MHPWGPSKARNRLPAAQGILCLPAVLALTGCRASSTADSGQVPKCRMIPALAAQRRRLTSSPTWRPQDGDGLVRIVPRQLVLAAHG